MLDAATEEGVSRTSVVPGVVELGGVRVLEGSGVFEGWGVLEGGVNKDVDGSVEDDGVVGGEDGSVGDDDGGG